MQDDLQDLCNRHPVLYLGKDRDKDVYYFFANKNGIGRFLRYQAYPIWCRSSDIGDFISLNSPLPDQIFNDILLFVNGRISYEVQPKRRGRAEKIIKHEIPRGQTAVDSAGDTSATNTEGLSDKPPTKRRRRTSEKQPTVQATPTKQGTEVAKSEEITELAPRKRGRPKKSVERGGDRASGPTFPGTLGGAVVEEPTKRRGRRSVSSADLLAQPRSSTRRPTGLTIMPVETKAKPVRKTQKVKNNEPKATTTIRKNIKGK